MDGHSTTADTFPNEGAPGGAWSVGCTCGWAKVGQYARSNEISEGVAFALASAYGTMHEEDPGAEPG